MLSKSDPSPYLHDLEGSEIIFDVTRAIGDQLMTKICQKHLFMSLKLGRGEILQLHAYFSEEGPNGNK